MRIYFSLDSVNDWSDAIILSNQRKIDLSKCKKHVIEVDFHDETGYLITEFIFNQETYCN